MLEEKSKTKIKHAILSISLVQMSTNGITSILADISKSFPEQSIEKIQLLMTFPSIFIFTITLLSAWLCRYLAKRILVQIGLVLILLSGILTFFFHDNLILLFCWSGFLGTGVGFVASITISLISDYFKDNEKEMMMGIQISTSNMGCLIMTFAGGILALIHWHYNYLIFLLTLPGIVLSYTNLPLENTHVKKCEKVHLEKSTWMYCAVAAFFMLIYSIGPTNIALFVSEERIGNTAISGTFASVLLIGGIITGFFFSKATTHLGNRIISLGFILLAIGYLILYLSNSFLFLGIGCLIIGSSNSFVMPQCMLQVSAKGTSAAVTMSLALIISFCNLGIFITPVLTGATRVVMDSNTAKDRFLFATIVGIISAICLFPLFSSVAKKEKKHLFD